MAVAEAPRRRRRALLIATGNYTEPGLAALRAPAGDVRSLSAVLADSAIGQFDVKALVDRPTDEIQREIDEFFGDARRDDLLLLYISGHGVLSQDRQLYFATATTKLKLLRSTAIADSFVNTVMQHSRARSVVLVFDCCHSGAFARGQRPKSALGVDMEHRFDTGRGRVTLTASTELEYAFEEDDLESDVSRLKGPSAGSVFTRCIVEGLETGAADVDEDGVISVDELYDYVCASVRERSPNQTPGMSGDKRGDILIARSRRAPKLPREYTQAIQNPLPSVRRGAVADLETLLKTASPALAATIVETLEALAHDDSRTVSSAAEEVLERRGLRERPPRPRPEREPPAAELVQPPTVPDETPARARRRSRPAVSLGRRGRVLVAAAGVLVTALAGVVLLSPGSPEKAPYDFNGDGRQELVASFPQPEEDRDVTHRLVTIHDGPDGDVQYTINADEAEVEERPAEQMGFGLASADFDGDGEADLAVGTPSAETVTVLYGKGEEFGRPEVLRGPEMDLPVGTTKYGFPVLALNLDGDEFGDLVVGAPGPEDTKSGALQILYGSDEGLKESRRQILSRTDVSQFGRRIGAGDVNGDQRIDLVEGAENNKGYGGHLSWCKGADEGLERCRPLDDNGTDSLAVADLDGDGDDETIVGEVREYGTDSNDPGAAGEVRVWAGGKGGPARDAQSITRASLEDASGEHDEFGTALDAADFDGDRDGEPELVVGAPGAGRVFVLRWEKDAADLDRVVTVEHGDESGFGSDVALLRMTGGPGADLAISAPDATEPEDRLTVVRSGGREPERLPNLTQPDWPQGPIPIGRAAGG